MPDAAPPIHLADETRDPTIALPYGESSYGAPLDVENDVATHHLRAMLHARLHRRRDDFEASKELHRLNASPRMDAGGAEHPQAREPDSRSTRTSRRSVLVLALGAALVAAAIHFGPGLVFYLVFVAVSLAIGVVCWTTLVWMVYAWRSPSAFDETRAPAATVTTFQSFSLLVPARHEEQVLGATLERIAATDHPDFEILVVVGDDDPETRAVAERVAAAHPDIVRVVVDDSVPKNKPKALNTALPYCRGDIVGVFDAEDDVNTELLARVDQCFQESGADVVQAGVQLVNIRSSWFAARNALEYYFWFRSRLHFHARAGFIPLGGNTVFVRTALLRSVGGWDGECLAEDCELGVRLSSLGAKTVVFYEPALATREETPPDIRAFVRQRTRWSQGYLQTLSRNHWRALPRRQRALGLYTLAMPYLMSVVWLMFPLALATALIVNVSVLLSFLSFLPAIPMLAVLAVEVAGLGEFCRSFGLRARIRDYARLVVSLPFYQFVLAFAASRAVVREARGVQAWEKTAHYGLHLESGVAATTDVALGQTSAHGAGAQVDVLVRERAPAVEGPPSTGGIGTAAPLPERLPLAKPDCDTSSESRTDVGSARPWTSRVAIAVPLTLVFVFVSWVQLVNLSHWPATFFDEGTYISNAWAVPRGALSNYTYGYGHPPLAWLLVSLWTQVSSVFRPTLYSVAVGRELMALLAIASCLLLYVLARRLGFGRVAAAAATAIFALSPLALYFHRLVLIDNPGVTFLLASLVLALSPRRRLWVFAASGACFAGAVLCKETILVLLPVLALAAVQNADRRTRRYCLTLVGSFVVLTALAYPLYAVLKGELFPGAGHVSLLGEAHTQLVTRKATGSVFDTTSQTFGTVKYWFHLDPFLLWPAVVLSPFALFARRTRLVAVGFLIQCVMVMRPGYLPFMYVIAMLPFAALVVAGSAEALWGVARRPGTPGRAPRWWPIRSLRARSRVSWCARIAAAAALTAIVAVFALGAAPGWSGADRDAMTLRLDGPEQAAKQWLLQHVDREQRILVADDFWVFLIEHGYDSRPVKGGFFSRTVVFYWPFDFDPAVRQAFPGGWKDLDYVVSTEGMRNDTAQVHRTAQAIEHSELVTSFGKGAQRIDIRRIDHPQSASTAATPRPGADGSG